MSSPTPCTLSPIPYTKDRPETKKGDTKHPDKERREPTASGWPDALAKFHKRRMGERNPGLYMGDPWQQRYVGIHGSRQRVRMTVSGSNTRSHAREIGSSTTQGESTMEHLATCTYDEQTDVIGNVTPCEDVAEELEAIYDGAAHEIRAGLKGWTPYTALIASTGEDGSIRHYLYGEE